MRFHAGSKQWIQELNPGIKKPSLIILPLLILNSIQVLISLKTTSQITDMTLRQPNYQIKNSLISWFLASMRTLLN